MEDVDRLARVVAISQAKLGMLGAAGAIECRVPLPAGDDLRVIWNPRAVVIFRLKIRRRQD